jgi:hypothetical protein
MIVRQPAATPAGAPALPKAHPSPLAARSFGTPPTALQAPRLPSSFHGLVEEGLRLLDGARGLTGLPVVTEVIEPQKAAAVGAPADRPASAAGPGGRAGGHRAPRVPQVR